MVYSSPSAPAPIRVASGPRKMSTSAANGTEMPSISVTAEEYPLSVSSLDPLPRDLLHATCTPAASMLPMAPIISRIGLARP